MVQIHPCPPVIFSRHLAQPGSASGLGPEGRKFKSFNADQHFRTPAHHAVSIFFSRGFVAQLVEHRFEGPGVTSSTLVKTTTVLIAQCQSGPMAPAATRLFPCSNQGCASTLQHFLLSYRMSFPRRGGREVDCAGLEHQLCLTAHQGSNPCLSAIIIR